MNDDDTKPSLPSDVMDDAPSADGLADFDADRYLPEMAEFDMSEEQKLEFLLSYWSILRAFVDLGFDVAKADICGQIAGDFNSASSDELDRVE